MRSLSFLFVREIEQKLPSLIWWNYVKSWNMSKRKNFRSVSLLRYEAAFMLEL